MFYDYVACILSIRVNLAAIARNGNYDAVRWSPSTTPVSQQERGCMPTLTPLA